MREQISDFTTARINAALNRLVFAFSHRRREGYCLGLWSKFIRERDGHRCVLCENTSGLAAHHIVRKCRFPNARLSPGNGITLCRECHAEPHEAFNGRPDVSQPLDAEGGERLDFMMGLYGELAQDALDRGQRRDDWYFLSNRVLRQFQIYQGVPDSAHFSGTPVEQAYWIWRQTSRGILAAIAEANGVSFPSDLVQKPGVVTVDDGTATSVFLTGLPGETATGHLRHFQ